MIAHARRPATIASGAAAALGGGVGRLAFVDAGPVEEFEEQRSRLFGLAYRLLGSAAEAEDAVQDAFLRWSRADRAAIEVPAAWLTRVVTNLCLNRLSSAREARECYAGVWLPEPVFTGGGALGPLETAEQRELVSMGMLLLLERLTPAERAVFVLREAFGHGHREIAEILGIDEAHSRQLHRRARAHVAEPHRRFAADDGRHRELVARFLRAAAAGDLAELERLLADDVVAWADGGGRKAARRPVAGRPKVLRYLLGLLARPEAEHARPFVEEVNGQVAVALRGPDGLVAVVVPELADGRVTAVRLVVEENKLAFAAAQRT